MNRITVFCGSSIGSEDIFESEARLLGQKMAEQNIGLVYGGAKIGLMGALADGALKHKGEVIGVDMTEEQLDVANRHIDYHTEAFGFKTNNVRFIKGNIF